jgi:hypothetical protein
MTMSKPNHSSTTPRRERARAAMILILDSVVMLGELMWLPHEVANSDAALPERPRRKAH